MTKDLGTMNNLTANTQTNALRLMKFLAEKYLTHEIDKGYKSERTESSYSM